MHIYVHMYVCAIGCLGCMMIEMLIGCRCMWTVGGGEEWPYRRVGLTSASAEGCH